MQLATLSDDVLVAHLKAVCDDERCMLTRTITYLAEVEERRIHLKRAFSSMFDFCTTHLAMSEGEAYRRIVAARLLKSYPSLLGRIERGEIHLSALMILRDHLTPQNCEQLFSEASGKSKRRVQELVARHFPRPDVPSQIRKLPSSTSADATSDRNLSLAASSAPNVCSALGSEQSASNTTLTLSPPLSTPTSPTPTSPTPRPKPNATVEPLSASRFKVQLTAGTELRDKLERATQLMRHQNPSGDLAVVVERALDLLLAKLEKDKLGKTARPQKKPRPAKENHVTRAARGEAYTRAKEQCTFVDDRTGRRCTARGFLEMDHLHPRARGGSSDASNLAIACRAHNFLRAEQAFGREHVEDRIRLRRNKSIARGSNDSNDSNDSNTRRRHPSRMAIRLWTSAHEHWCIWASARPMFVVRSPC